MTPGQFHRPAPNAQPNAFESAKRGQGHSAILAADPSMRHRKRGPSQILKSMQFTTYSKAVPSAWNGCREGASS